MDISRRSFFLGLSAVAATAAVGRAAALTPPEAVGDYIQTATVDRAGRYTVSAFVKPMGKGWYRVAYEAEMSAPGEIVVSYRRLAAMAEDCHGIDLNFAKAEYVSAAKIGGELPWPSSLVISFGDKSATFNSVQVEFKPAVEYFVTRSVEPSRTNLIPHSNTDAWLTQEATQPLLPWEQRRAIELLA